MKTHLSFDGICVRWKFKALSEHGAGYATSPVSTLPEGSEFIAYGRLVSPNGAYVNAPYVSIYWCRGIGYGYLEK